MTTRVAFSAAMRQAAVELLTDYATTLDTPLKLQVYPGRPRSLYPPTAFVDRIRERVVYTGPYGRQRTPEVDVLVVHGLFDSADTVAQRDAFVDGFMDYVTDNPHRAHQNSTIGAVRIEDDPNWIPDWLNPDDRGFGQYYATTITLEGLIWD